MTPNRFLPAIAAVLLLPVCAAAESPVKNAIVFLVDDMGWTDLGCFGSDCYETPNIDALAASGTKFTNAYAACTVCSPTRAALMTGQYPARLHVTDFIPGHPFVNTPLNIPVWTQVLEPQHVTLAEALRPAGLRTIHAGKWHLAHRDKGAGGGEDNPDPTNYPQHHGFDVNIGGNERGAPKSYYWPYGTGKTLEQRKDNSIYRTLPEGGEEGEYLTDRLATEVLKELKTCRSEKKPFFLYFAFYNVHTPLQARPDLLEKYEKKIAANPGLRHNNPKYAAMVESVDEAVGRLIDFLKEENIFDETLIIFTSDNGGLKPQATNNLPIRNGKGSIYEGGVRVPAIVRWPGVGTPGGVREEPVITMDYYPTVLEALGVNVPNEVEPVLDGLSLSPVLKDETASLDRDALYWHYPHYHSQGAQPYSAVRAGGWKLIEHHDGKPSELYHISEDIHEDSDLYSSQPEKAAQLKKMLEDWREQVGAQMATTNDSFDASQPTGINRGGKIREQVPIRVE